MRKTRQIIVVNVDPLAEHSWRIWGYCRDNRSSPDAERHAKRVADLLLVAVEMMTEKAIIEIQELRAEVAQLKQEAAEESQQKKTDMAEGRWEKWRLTKAGNDFTNRVIKGCKSFRPIHQAFISGANWRPNNADKK